VNQIFDEKFVFYWNHKNGAGKLNFFRLKDNKEFSSFKIVV
jgi:hypothetical protein